MRREPALEPPNLAVGFVDVGAAGLKEHGITQGEIDLMTKDQEEPRQAARLDAN